MVQYNVRGMGSSLHQNHDCQQKTERMRQVGLDMIEICMPGSSSERAGFSVLQSLNSKQSLAIG